MKKRRIVIASVLKPVDDTRMFGKMGVTLSDSGQFEIVIIGYPTKAVPAYANIQFLPLKPFARLSLARVLAPFKIFQFIRQANPDILVVNTHELLIVAVLNRIFFGTKILYDVRENYYRNILYSGSFPPPLRPLLAGWVRLKEKLAAPLFHHFFLAENGYRKEMNFFHSRATLLENKAIVPAGLIRSPSNGKIRLLFSGTLAESTGVFQAIKVAKELHTLNEAIQLVIIGYCAKAETLNRIEEEIKGSSFIQLRGGDKLVPHPEVIHAIYDADFGIVCYPPSRHTENAIPTKLYEYLACRLPMLLQNHALWVELALPYQAAIPIDFPTIDPAVLLAQMKGPFYTKLPTESSITWEKEGKKMVEVIDNLS